MKTGIFGSHSPMNVSDFAIAVYLDGGFQMKASEFEKFLSLRNEWTTEIVSLGSTTSLFIMIFLLGGFTVSTLRTALSVRRLRRIIKNSYEWRHFNNIHIRVCETTQIPFSTRGLRKPLHHYALGAFGKIRGSAHGNGA